MYNQVETPIHPRTKPNVNFHSPFGAHVSAIELRKSALYTIKIERF